MINSFETHWTIGAILRHSRTCCKKDVDGRDKHGHDGSWLRKSATAMLVIAAAIMVAAAAAHDAAAQSCAAMRKINVGVSVAPPNVVHASPYVANELGFFAKHCIAPTIVQFEGGQSATSNAAAAQGSAIISVSDVAIGRGLK